MCYDKVLEQTTPLLYGETNRMFQIRLLVLLAVIMMLIMAAILV
jgi:hypothetical protein